jgi:hypothetical protein
MSTLDVDARQPLYALLTHIRSHCSIIVTIIFRRVIVLVAVVIIVHSERIQTAARSHAAAPSASEFRIRRRIRTHPTFSHGRRSHITNITRATTVVAPSQRDVSRRARVRAAPFRRRRRTRRGASRARPAMAPRQRVRRAIHRANRGASGYVSRVSRATPCSRATRDVRREIVDCRRNFARTTFALVAPFVVATRDRGAKGRTKHRD